MVVKTFFIRYINLLFVLLFLIRTIQLSSDLSLKRAQFKNGLNGCFVYDLPSSIPIAANINHLIHEVLQVPITLIKKNPFNPLISKIAFEEMQICLLNDYFIFSENSIYSLGPKDIKYPSHYFW